MEFDLKWVHMARYELILRLDGALWLRIILKPLHEMTKKTEKKNIKNILELAKPIYPVWIRRSDS